MAIKVNVGFNRKVGEPNYSSRGASVHLEVELDRMVIDEAGQFQSEIEHIFERIRDAVEQELKRGDNRSDDARQSSDAQADRTGRNGNREAPRPATASQVRAIHAIARRQEIDLDRLLAAEFAGKQAEELSITEASFLIDRMQSSSFSDNRH
jgi:hypothetical protein